MLRQQMKKLTNNAIKALVVVYAGLHSSVFLFCFVFVSPARPQLSDSSLSFPSLTRPLQPSARPSIPWTGRRSGATLSPSSASSGTTTCRRRFTVSRSLAPSGTPTNRSRGSCGWSTRTLAKVGQSHQSLPHEAASPLKKSHYISA